RALSFAGGQADAERRALEIGEARRLRGAGEPMPWGGVHDLDCALVRGQKGGGLEGPDLRQVAETPRAGATPRRFLLARPGMAPALREQVLSLSELSELEGPIPDAFEPSGRLCDHASPALGPLRRRAAELHAELGRTVRGLLDDETLGPLLQDRYYTQRDDRY